MMAAAASGRAEEPGATSHLQQFSESVEALVKRVSPSVVQVLVTGYGPLDDREQNDADLIIGRQRTMGSGVVIDGDGYIVTNAHVVSGSHRVEVVLPDASADEAPIRSLKNARGRTVDAHVIGVSREVDLALLKVDVSGLPAIPIADYDLLRPGQLVFAFGSPEGLRNSVTMGVVSAVARQAYPDHPMVYIQTDAPINHGNSGGPLVNVRGELVGINAFILSDSGGSQGLGFAIPSAVVSVAYTQLRKHGHLHRGGIGLDVQTVTPDLARALSLPQDWGVIVSDLLPGGPSDVAGLQPRDIIVSIDGRPVDSLPYFAFQLYTRRAGDHVKLTILRGREHIALDVPMIERPDDLDRLADLVDPEKSLVPRLGVLGVSIDERILAMLPALRIGSGVVVAGRTQDPRAADVSLLAGDVIHSVNGVTILSLEQLRSALDKLNAHGSVALQIERDGKFSFVSFQLD